MQTPDAQLPDVQDGRCCGPAKQGNALLESVIASMKRPVQIMPATKQAPVRKFPHGLW
jgi:hypothetical protein